MKIYIGLVRKEKGTSYGVNFPDFPGCYTLGDTLEKAQAMAIECLDLHSDGLIEDGIPLPEPSSFDSIIQDPENGAENENILAIHVPVADKRTKSIRVDITVPEDISLQVDRFVNQAEGYNRSSFYAEAGLEKLQRVLVNLR